MPKPIAGLHHVTAIASNPQRNLDFYTEVLGLRLVKRTINFDDPGSYHLYFGDDAGAPGTILTFFPWPHATRGSFGVGETAATTFRVPTGSIDFWQKHLLANGVPVERLGQRFDEDDEQVITFPDPDGMRLEIAAHAQAGPPNPSRFATAIPHEHAIRGFHGVTLALQEAESTAAILKTMGFAEAAKAANRTRFSAPGDALGRHIDLVVPAQPTCGRMGAGSVHHIAFRAPDDATQQAWATALADHGLHVTPVQDRTYFRSIYFRTPGGVLFEIATDPPGFTLDESSESLGETLKLPPWLEPTRAAIEHHLPILELHKDPVTA